MLSVLPKHCIKFWKSTQSNMSFRIMDQSVNNKHLQCVRGLGKVLTRRILILLLITIITSSRYKELSFQIVFSLSHFFLFSELRWRQNDNSMLHERNELPNVLWLPELGLELSPPETKSKSSPLYHLAFLSF